ncbi:MAG: PASTA domain-containing protein [Bacteroidales bacterium]|jgi:beta-lactam-binding protein with PASTA domain|nr:PASTA domain-containing protein [Bacteroidales bacterium]
MKFIEFLKTSLFYKHIALAFFAGILLIWGTLQILSVYTRHGEFVEMPGFMGQPISEIELFAINNDMEVVILDSIFDPRQEKGCICMQEPPEGAKIKQGRKLYITIVASTSEKVAMPNLIDISLRQAVSAIEGAGLQIDYIDYVPGEYKNAVSAQRIATKAVRSGEMIPRSSKIVIEVELGTDGFTTVVPNLIGLDYSMSNKSVFSSSLNVGRISYLENPQPEGNRVYKQFPSPGRVLQPGSSVDIWFRKEDGFDYSKAREESKIDTDTLITDEPE